MERLRSDERGLVGKSIIVMMILLVVIGIAAVDTASILFVRLTIGDVATAAALDAARAYDRTGSVQEAQGAAEGSLREHPDVELVGDILVDRATGNVTLTIKKKASTIIVDEISFTEKYAVVRVTVTQEPPTV